MSRLTRNRIVQAKIETTYGTDPGTWAAADAVLCAEVSMQDRHEPVSRDLIRPYLGASEQIQVTGRRTLTLRVEFAGSGTAGTAPKYGPLLRACGMAQTLTASVLASYTPVSTGFESVTIRYWNDGVLNILTGARGNAMLRLGAYELPMIEFTFDGLNVIDPTAVASPGSDYTGWQPPRPTISTAGAEMRLGGTYATGTGIVTGGTVLTSRGIGEINLGNSINHMKLLGGESMDLTNREVTGRLSTFLTAADEVSWRNAIKANNVTSLSWFNGTAAGNIVGVFGPSVQRIEPQEEDYEGRVMLATGLRFVPVTGNDEIRLVVR